MQDDGNMEEIGLVYAEVDGSGEKQYASSRGGAGFADVVALPQPPRLPELSSGGYLEEEEYQRYQLPTSSNLYYYESRGE